ncbi:MAG: hypothetical protein WKF58_00420 [Ilumatobacteraceae bacterium]
MSTSSLPRSTVAVGGLRHALVVGGTGRQWREATEAQWRERIETLGTVALGSGASWLTLRPYGDDGEDHGVLVRSEHRLTHGDATCVVIVEPMADGRTRFATAMADLDPAGDVTESAVAERALPAGGGRTRSRARSRRRPHAAAVAGVGAGLRRARVLRRLVGPARRRRPRPAIDEFTNRNRRFGGLP